MNVGEFYAEDLWDLVEVIDERGIFEPGEREAWEEEIRDADADYRSLMSLNQALIDAMDGREGMDEVIDEHTHPETNTFV
ncbi:MAG: hypothetical protein HQRvContig05_24 [Haloquadratum phage sp.]|nr:MAG: hypothetical protein HQRvContig05_24 [Haloquadratum phage sp.]